jgi:hypothetical protein
MRKKFFLLIIAATLFLYNSSAQTPNASKPSAPSLMKGKGTLSFKINGQLYNSDSTQTKCWTTATVPLAMLWAKGNNINISWQIRDMQGTGSYRIDKDSKGSINFTINNKTYWVRKTDGSNYLNISITNVKEVYTVKLLSGTFEGILEDKDGNKVQVIDGKFNTKGI